MSPTQINWLDHDFRPAPPGWRVAHVSEIDIEGYTNGLFIAPLPGWLVQVENRFDERTGWNDDDQPPRAQRERRIIAASHSGSQLEAIDYQYESFWYVLSPDEPDPTPAETRAELTARATRTTQMEAPR